MGYTTEFDGSLSLSKNLTTEQFNYLNTFSNTRRMKRDVNKLMVLYKGKFGYPQFQSNLLPESIKSISEMEFNGETGLFEEQNTELAEKIYGKDGEFFAHNDGINGQSRDESIIDYNTPPGQLSWDGGISSFIENEQRSSQGLCQPGLWCQWIIEQTNDTQKLVWDGGEKFYSYIEWLQYLITNFFNPWDVLLNGAIKWNGEEFSDSGVIIVVNNNIHL